MQIISNGGGARCNGRERGLQECANDVLLREGACRRRLITIFSHVGSAKRIQTAKLVGLCKVVEKGSWLWDRSATTTAETRNALCWLGLRVNGDPPGERNTSECESEQMLNKALAAPPC